MDIIFPALDPNKCLKTYGKVDRKPPSEASKNAVLQLPQILKERKPLTTKNAVEHLLNGTLKSKVCRYCLNLAPDLSHLDQILQVAGKGTSYKVAIKDIVVSFYPFKVTDDPNFPNKICENCLDRAVSCYLFIQQCDQAQRALRNCFEDIYEKLVKLDPVEPVKKRGRHKLHPNHNTINAEHKEVMDYAEPVINIINTTETLTNQTPISDLECLKCCEVLPSIESLINHSKTHPSSMWFNCRLCGMSYPKRSQIKKHFNTKHAKPTQESKLLYDCKRCGLNFDKCYEYLQHIEKHRFKTVMEHLVEKKMDKLCALCFNKGSNMMPLEETICLHGGCAELTGDRPLYAILASTLPEIHLDSYTGTKICEKCINNALTSYVFIHQSHFSRSRLNTCISAMLDRLNEASEYNNNICIEIASNAVMNVAYNDNISENDKDDDTYIDVLEDEFRVKSEDETEIDNKLDKIESVHEVKTHTSLINGYAIANNVCSEFLTFKKPNRKPKRGKFTCPVCKKHFISDYFLKRHCVKHFPRKVECKECKIVFETKFDLYEHKKMSHIFKVKTYLSCKYCRRCFIEKCKLDSHEKYHKNPLCQLCFKKFNSQNTYINHMYRHMNKSAISMKKHKQFCSFCEKDCSNDNEFSLHVNKVHLQIKPYSCDMCERNFYTEYNLRCHRRVHSVYSKEQCEFCNKKLYSRKKLVIHIRKHIGDTPFCCELCDKSFYTQMRLRKHLSACHGGRFLCRHCKTTFVTKKELNCHTNMVHTVS